MVDRGQLRAAHAWKVVQSCGKDYANLAKAAPALIMGNGLMQTLAFFQGKEDHHRQLNQHICQWLAEMFQGRGQFPAATEARNLRQDDLFKRVMEGLALSQPAEYRQATEEAMALLRWIRQFASAVTG